MQEHYDRLGIKVDASEAEIKLVYHAKLKEFPAHTHPQDFKAVRSAYEAIRKGESPNNAPFFKPQTENVELNSESIQKLRERAIAQVEVNLNELLRLTF